MKVLIKWTTTLAFLFSQFAQAATAPARMEPLAHVSDLVKASGVASRPTKLRDILELTKDRLPMDFRFEVERFIELYPNYKLPQAEIRKIKNGKFEDLQMTFVQDKQSISIVFSMRPGDIGTFTYSQNGKNVNRKLTEADLADPVALMTSVLGKDQAVTTRFPFAILKYAQQISDLKPEEQKAYLNLMQDTVATMERVQATFIKKAKKTALQQMVVGDFAQAATDDDKYNGQPCVSLGGWPGTFQGTYCKPEDKEASYQDKPICNPSVYGGNSKGEKIFVKTDVPSGADYCKAEAKRLDFGPMFRFSKAEELDSEYARISKVLDQLAMMCAVRTGPIVERQQQQCAELTAQMGELKQMNCQALIDKKGSSNACAEMLASGQVKKPDDSAKPEVKVKASVPDGQDERAAAGTTTQPRKAADDKCPGLPKNENDLKCEGQYHQQLACGGYYCSCPQGTVSIYGDAPKAIGCRAKYGSYDDRSNTGATGRTTPLPGETPKESHWYDKAGSFLKNNWVPILTIGALIGVGMIMINANESSQMASVQQYYNNNAPTTPAIAPPPVTTNPTIATPTGSAFPSIPGRPLTTGVPGSGYTFTGQAYVPGAPTNGVLKRGNRNSTTGP